MRIDRLNEMEALILERGTVKMDDLAEEFDVSSQTVRRDISELLNRGRIQKVYGGVSSVYSGSPSVPISSREQVHLGAKSVIGRITAPLVEDDSVIYLDTGTTIPYMIPHLATKKNISVVTNSLRVMSQIERYPSIHLLALGGYFHPETSSFIGGSTVDEINNLVFDRVFFATTGLSIEKGLTLNTYYEREIKRTIVEKNKKRIVLLADSSKFDTIALFSICDFEDLEVIVTEKDPDVSYLKKAEEVNVRILTPSANHLNK